MKLSRPRLSVSTVSSSCLSAAVRCWGNSCWSGKQSGPINCSRNSRLPFRAASCSHWCRVRLLAAASSVVEIAATDAFVLRMKLRERGARLEAQKPLGSATLLAHSTQQPCDQEMEYYQETTRLPVAGHGRLCTNAARKHQTRPRVEVWRLIAHLVRQDGKGSRDSPYTPWRIQQERSFGPGRVQLQ